MRIIKQLTINDIDAVECIAAEVYPIDLYESKEKFVQLINLCPQFGLFYNGVMQAYLFSHPWTLDQIVPINSLVQLPQIPTCYYIHDLAVTYPYRGKGLAKALFYKALEHFNNLPIKLISVLDSRRFWEKLGFEVVEPIQYTERIQGFVMLKFTIAKTRV